MVSLRIVPLLVVSLLLVACDGVVGIGQRSVDGEWVARIDGERVWMSLQDDGREIWGLGEWGYDDVYITGDQAASELFLIFEFRRYSAIELQGVVRNGEIEGRLYGSGLDGERVRFYRDRLGY